MASTILLVVVFVFDVIAFALAVAAEQRRNTATLQQYDRTNTYYCRYDSDKATGLGVGALLFLMASQVIIMVASRCLCGGKAMMPSRSRTWAIVLFISSWVFFFIAEVCLLAGSVRNAYQTKGYITDVSSCKTLRKGVFGAGAAFIVFTGIVTALYYVSYRRANEDQSSYARDTGLRMGNL